MKKFVFNRFSDFPSYREKSNLPTMTSTELFLTTKQRVQSLLTAGQNLLASRLGPQYFEQTGSSVNENITDEPLRDLHDVTLAMNKMKEKEKQVYESNLRLAKEQHQIEQSPVTETVHDEDRSVNPSE